MVAPFRCFSPLNLLYAVVDCMGGRVAACFFFAALLSKLLSLVTLCLSSCLLPGAANFCHVDALHYCSAYQHHVLRCHILVFAWVRQVVYTGTASEKCVGSPKLLFRRTHVRGVFGSAKQQQCLFRAGFRKHLPGSLPRSPSSLATAHTSATAVITLQQ